MEIILSNASPKPIYEQITSRIKAMIMNGELKAGDPMPSMRNYAEEQRRHRFQRPQYGSRRGAAGG